MAVKELEIIYRDDAYIAINKPAGLLVHPSIIDRHESENALDLLQQQIGQAVYMIHRLDKPTSGILIFELSSEAARKSVATFSTGQVRKTYLAVVRGYTEDQQVIDSPLKPVKDKIMVGREKQNKAPKAALTRIQKLAEVELQVAVGRYPTARYSLVEVHPKTGKMHQIRRHLKHIRHPVVGDTKYGDPVHNRFFRERWNAHRLMLAATQLEFFHPFTLEKIRITAPLDTLFISILSDLDWLDVIPDTWLAPQN
jgi:tRNA pseudouridine65 synthase